MWQAYANGGMSNGGSVGINGQAGTGVSVLTEDQMRRNVPSIYAEGPHDSRSERYGYVPTYKVLRALSEHGFDPFYAQQQRSRKAGRVGFTKHIVRLRHRTQTTETGEAHDLILMNAHDGGSAWVLLHGIFRAVCMNGLYTGDAFGKYRVTHRGDAIEKVVEASAAALHEGAKIMDVVADWKEIRLPEQGQRLFAEGALQIRFDGDLDKSPVGPGEINAPRRSEDWGDNLWVTFNRCQENVMQGGQRGFITTANGQTRRKTIRKVNGIDQKREMNDRLFGLAQQIAGMVK